MIVTPNSARFHEILKELARLHDKKPKRLWQYHLPICQRRASTDWGIPPYVGALVRLNDKVKRCSVRPVRRTR